MDYLPENSENELMNVERTEGYCVETALRHWAITTNQTYESIGDVMDIIRNVSLCKFPKAAKTLLKTNTNASKKIVTINGTQCWYHGIRQCLLNNLRCVGNKNCFKHYLRKNCFDFRFHLHRYSAMHSFSRI